MSKQKFTPADRKALAMAAFLFYFDKGYKVTLHHCVEIHELFLTVYYDNLGGLEPCPQAEAIAGESYSGILDDGTRYTEWDFAF